MTLNLNTHTLHAQYNDPCVNLRATNSNLWLGAADRETFMDEIDLRDKLQAMFG